VPPLRTVVPHAQPPPMSRPPCRRGAPRSRDAPPSVGRPPRAPSSRLSTWHPFPVRHRTSERCSPLTLCRHSRMPRPGCGVLPAHPPFDAACPPHLPVEHPASAPDAHNGARMGTSLPCWAPRPNPVGRSPTFGRPIRRPERRVISRLGGGGGSVGGCGHATSERPRPLRDATPPIDYRKHRIAVKLE